MENQGMEKKRRRVVLVPFPFQGHLSPMLELGTALHSKGFSITVIHTHFNSPNPSNYPDFEFLPMPDGLTDQDTSSRDLVALLLTLNTNCEAPLKEILGRMMEREGMRDQLACIIRDTTMYAAEPVANHLKLPSIIFRYSGACGSLVYASVPRLQEAGYFPLQDSMLQEMVPGLHPITFKDFPTANLGNKNIMKLMETMDNVKTSSAIIWNSMDCLEHPALAELQKQHQVPFFAVGPLFKIASVSSSSILEEDTNCISWLDKQAPNSVLYVSIGSLAYLDEKKLAEMAWGLSNSGQPFLWAIRPGSIYGSEWIELLPEGFQDVIGERGCIVKWAPQKKVLAHGAIGGFWSHCGWNSTLESVSEGVPMICSPCFGDHSITARYVSHVWKVGLELDDELIERKNIERVVRRLMEDKEGKEIKQRATDLKKKVDLCVRDGGSSHNSLNALAEYIYRL